MKVLKLKKIIPTGAKILVTAEQYLEDQFIPGTTLINPEKKSKGLKEYQTVLAVGEDVTRVKVGQLVKVNPADYMRKAYSRDNNSLKQDMSEVYNPTVEYLFDLYEVDDQLTILIKERDIDFIVEEAVEVEDSTSSVDVDELMNLNKSDLN